MVAEIMPATCVEWFHLKMLSFNISDRLYQTERGIIFSFLYFSNSCWMNECQWSYDKNATYLYSSMHFDICVLLRWMCVHQRWPQKVLYCWSWPIRVQDLSEHIGQPLLERMGTLATQYTTKAKVTAKSYIFIFTHAQVSYSICQATNPTLSVKHSHHNCGSCKM